LEPRPGPAVLRVWQGARPTFGCVPTALTRRSASPGERLFMQSDTGTPGRCRKVGIKDEIYTCGTGPMGGGGQTLNPLHYPSPLRGWTRSCDRATPSTEPLKMKKWALVPLSMAEREGKGGVGSDRTESVHRNLKVRPISQGRIELDQ